MTKRPPLGARESGLEGQVVLSWRLAPQTMNVRPSVPGEGVHSTRRVASHTCIQHDSPSAVVGPAWGAQVSPVRTLPAEADKSSAYSVVPSTSRSYQPGESLAVLHGNALGRRPQAHTGSGGQEGARTAAPGRRKVVRVDPQEIHVRLSLWLTTTPWGQRKRSLVAGGPWLQACTAQPL